MINSSDLARQYSTVRHRYEHLTRVLQQLLETMLSQEELKFFVEARTKAVDHFVEKATRPGKSYSDPITEISDLAGVRVIVQSPADLERVRALLKQEFEIDWSRSVDKATELDVDQFGYQSDHYVLKLKGLRAIQREHRDIAELWAEVQIRTVLQDAWAKISHFLLYKTKQDIPRSLQRQFYALSALFEIADREIDAVLGASQELIEQSKDTIRSTHGHVDIDAETLIAFLQESPTELYWINVIKSMNVGIIPFIPVGVILRMTSDADLRTISSIDSMLEASKDWGNKYLRNYYDNFRKWQARLQGKETAVIGASPGAVVSLFLIAHFPNVFTREALTKKYGWGSEDAALVTQVAESTSPHWIT